MNSKDFKTIILTVFHMFKKWENRLKMLSRDIEDPNQTSRDKNYNNWVENIPDDQCNRWDISEENISKLRENDVSTF